jgi:hypothetical protein
MNKKIDYLLKKWKGISKKKKKIKKEKGKK